MKKGFLLFVGALLASSSFAQFTSGRLVVVQVGDGTAPLTNAATASQLQEYDLAGTPGFSVNLPTALSGSNKRCTNSGSATSEGFLALSENGLYLTMMGYDADVGTPAVATTDALSVNRVVARVDSNGTVDTSTAFAAYSGGGTSSGNPRSAVSEDGTAFWTSGTSVSTAANGGSWYVALGGSNPTQIMATPNNARVAKIFDEQLYVSSASGANVGINQVGTGLPTTSGQTATRIIDTSVTTIGTNTSSPYDFFFSDSSTCYVSDDRTVANGGGIQKYTFDSGTSTWTYQYTMSANLPGGCRGLTGSVSKAGVTLYATTANGGSAGGNSIVTVTDTGPTSSFSIIATAPTNVAFRGISFTPSNPVVTILPTTTSLNPGIVISGTPSSMWASDDSYYVLRPGIVLSSAQSPIVLTMSGNAPGNNPSDLKMVVESRANQGNIRETVEAYNFSTMMYDQVNQTVLTTGDVVKTITIPNPAQHVGPGNEVRTKISYKAVGPVLNYPWRVSIDEATWRYTN